MPFVARHKWTWEEALGVYVLLDPLLFALAYWEEDLTIPASRLDLPAAWRGRQVISREQAMMVYDGAIYLLWRETLPELAAESSQKTALRTSRKIAKTLFMESRLIQVPLTKTLPGVQEGMLHCPRENHQAPIRNRYEKKLQTVALFALMHDNFDRDKGIDNWRSGWVWHWRIEGMSGTGTNMVGLRAYVMFGDEADYSGEGAYVERDQTALPGCAQVWGGVPRGVRGIFWRVCNTKEGKGWSIHRYDIRANPLYHSQAAFAEQVKDDWFSQRVQTQVLGRDGEEAISSFPVLPVDKTIPYFTKVINDVEFFKHQDHLHDFLRLPVDQVKEASAWMLHMDYGYAPSPSELGVSYLKNGAWHMLARLEVQHLNTTPTAILLNVVDAQILPQRADLIVVDAHGQGRGVLSALHEDPRWASENYIGRAIAVGFEGNTPMPGVLAHKKCKQIVRLEQDGYWTCDTCMVRIFDQREMSEATLNTKVYLTGQVKEMLGEGQRFLDARGEIHPGEYAIVLGDDSELIDELSGTTEIQSQAGGIRYITPHDRDHMTDMLRCLASGIARYENIKTDYGSFDVDDLGWAAGGPPGQEEAEAWEAPWDQ